MADKNKKFNENTSVRYWILIFYFNLHKNMIHVQLHTIPLWMFNLFLMKIISIKT